MPDDTGAKAQPSGRYRWGIVALLFTALAINYTHRQMLGLFKGELQTQFGWTEETYAGLVFWFQAAYAIGQMSFGRLLDVAGVRIGYAIGYVIWVLAHMATGMVTGVTEFAVARFALGLGESGAFPSSLKAISEWFPQKERALAAGVFNAGTSIGIMIAAAIIPFIALGKFHIGTFPVEFHGLNWGWRGSFLFTGALSFLWLIPWFIMYRRPTEHKKVSPAELTYIESGKVLGNNEKIGWFKLLTVKETWAYALGKFMIDPIWWLYLFWLPDFLHKNYGLDITSFGVPLIVIYLMSDIGSVAGGWLSSTLIHRGVSVNVARKTALFLFALCAVPMFFIHNVHDLWPAVLMIGLATAGHQAFSCNLYTLPSDLFPPAGVGSVLGIGGSAGAVGGMVMSIFVGWILQTTHSYTLIFAIAAFTYLLAFGVIHLITPKLSPAKV
ncbi:MFS transporter [Asticcacaulis sp. EMRT-3]|uniref:MFS transporter n=1 Tax=Asticcacaulis sp. EMRT-3 TaxID=3040349 RepID=UPI0024AFDD7E|nr:MFS transporter [Asticcacaulis sp. EMRT-3]MDI7775011.1 MFS transporter [Asticcacaulis sp. EMRT-3]